MTRAEVLTAEEQVNFKNALEHIEELKHLMEQRPVETFKELMKLNLPLKPKESATAKTQDRVRRIRPDWHGPGRQRGESN